MEHSQNIYGVFVVYRYVCIDVIITNSITVVFIQTCLRSYSALHRRSYMFGIKYFDLLIRPSILHRLLILSLHVSCFQSNKASLCCHLLLSKIYIDNPCVIIPCRIS